jgi:hypothetical protein
MHFISESNDSRKYKQKICSLYKGTLKEKATDFATSGTGSNPNQFLSPLHYSILQTTHHSYETRTTAVASIWILQIPPNPATLLQLMHGSYRFIVALLQE